MEKLFSNIGEKIKSFVMAFFVIQVVLYGISGLVMLIGFAKTNGFLAFLMFIATLAVGFLVAYISSLFLYGFGELVSNSQKLVDNSYTPQQPNGAFNNSVNNSQNPFNNSYTPQQPNGTFNNSVNNYVPSNNSPIFKDTVQNQPVTSSAPVTKTEPAANEWKCPQCGLIHQNYVGTCGCGCKKP